MAAQPTARSEEAALSLTMAVVASSLGPLVLLDGDLNVVVASRSFADAFQIDAASATGRPLSALGAGEWAVPQLASLLDATLSGTENIEAYEMDLKRAGVPPQRLVIHAEKLVYLDLDNKRVLMAVTDVTEARADAKIKEDALQQNLVLLQEVRHRVSNSLQIIASVLMMSAKRTQSEETRFHLNDAHHRVMSIAALERQLAGSGERTVDLKSYFAKLCDSIAASMIADRNHISLAVTGNGGIVDDRVSVSLGLIVTELVINALKHAFPDGRSGRIVVDCQVNGPNWMLSVTDDGVGMPVEVARVGLGTSIVQALAAQLQAKVQTDPAHPGTRVSITHTQIALVDDIAAESTNPKAVERPAA